MLTNGRRSWTGKHLKSYDVYELVPRTNGMRTLKLGCFTGSSKSGTREDQSPEVTIGVLVSIFSPVVHLESLRTILTLVAVRDLDPIQFDITSAYLHGQLKGVGASWRNQRVTLLPGREIGCGALRRAYTGS